MIIQDFIILFLETKNFQRQDWSPTFPLRLEMIWLNPFPPLQSSDGVRRSHYPVVVDCIADKDKHHYWLHTGRRRHRHRRRSVTSASSGVSISLRREQQQSIVMRRDSNVTTTWPSTLAASQASPLSLHTDQHICTYLHTKNCSSFMFCLQIEVYPRYMIKGKIVL